MSIVKRIQNLCSSKNTTLIGLEREIGLGRGTIRNWDNNSPSVEKIQKVAEYFGVSINRILYGTDTRELVEDKSPNITKTTKKIRLWAIDRNLNTADPNKQMLKLGEEFGELCAAMARGDEWATSDAIGDLYVVLTILSMQLGLSIEACVESSYEEIKDRKGRMVNGVFVKAEDLR